MKKKLLIIFILLGVAKLNVLQAQETKLSEPQKQVTTGLRSIKSRTYVDLDLTVPHFLGLGLTQGAVLKNGRLFLGLGVNLMSLKPDGEQKMGYYTPPSHKNTDPKRPTGLSDYTEITISEDSYMAAIAGYFAIRLESQDDMLGKGCNAYGDLRLGLVDSFIGSSEARSYNFHGYSRLSGGLVYDLKGSLRLNVGLHLDYISKSWCQGIRKDKDVRMASDSDGIEHQIKPFGLGFNIGLRF